MTPSNNDLSCGYRSDHISLLLKTLQGLSLLFSERQHQKAQLTWASLASPAFLACALRSIFRVSALPRILGKPSVPEAGLGQVPMFPELIGPCPFLWAIALVVLQTHWERPSARRPCLLCSQL